MLKRDAKNEEKDKTFYHLWKGPYTIATYHRSNDLILWDQEREPSSGGSVNG